MIYADFEALALEQAWLLLLYWGLGFSGLFLLTKKYTSGLLLNPFHFYYAFTYGTSYGVVALLASSGLISFEAGWIVFGLGFTFLVSFRYFSRREVVDLNPLIRLLTIPAWQYRTCFMTIVVLYLILVSINLSVSGFGFLAESRFESSLGYGPIIRLVEALRLIITAWFGLKIIRKIQQKKRFLLFAILLVCFLLFSSLVNGAKFALLEGCYSITIAAVVANVKFQISNFAKYLWITVFIVMISVFVLVILSFNIMATGGDPFAQSESVNGMPVLIERLVGRIIWNGDMYFLSLPDDIFKDLKIDSFFIRFASAIFGSQLVTGVVGYDAAQLEVGRLIWLYWTPDDPVMRGPTNHFDLTGYFYFGHGAGIVFVVILAMALSQVNRLVTGKASSSDYSAVIISVLWCKSVAMLMHPAAGLAWCIDLVAVLVLCKIFVFVTNPAAISPKTLLN